MVFDDTYAADIATNVARLVVIGATLLVLCLSIETVHGNHRETEYYSLLLLAAVGAIVLAGASDLMLLAAGYLVASVPVYALVAFVKGSGGPRRP